MTGIFLLAAVIAGCSAPAVQIIPQPQEISVQRGFFTGGSEAAVQVDPALTAELGDEGYRLDVDGKGIRITAATEAGAFYARQTLSQITGPQGVRKVHVKDVPRFAYRGFHVDVSRHFHDKAEIMKIIDAAAAYKFNNFHFHLTDNGGWRIQSDTYPLLTELGAYRVMKDWDGWWKLPKRLFCTKDTPGAYGGFYTKDDIREIVEYAAGRHINVIPEIEFPAHSDAVFAAYPQLCCEKTNYCCGEFCPANPEVYTFMESILGEVMELFPSKVIHIGADEARKNSWKHCPACNALMKKEGMTSYDDLQCYMVSRIASFLQSRGRCMGGWDELLKNEDLEPCTVVYSYRGEKGGIRAANRGLKTVLTPGEILYMDWYQASPEHEKKAMYGYSPIKKMYRFHPLPDTPEKAADNESLVETCYVSPDSVEYIFPGNVANVIGIQGCAWGEYIPTDEHLEYMMFPRLLAVAELAWTPEEKLSWERFRSGLPEHLQRLRDAGFNVYDLHNAPEVTYTGGLVRMESENPLATVRYTLDGSDPTEDSPAFRKPFAIKGKVLLKAAAFAKGAPRSYVREITLEEGTQALDYYPLTYYPQ